jgi:hypothetical protein
MKPNEIFIRSARIIKGDVGKMVMINKLIKKVDKKKEVQELKKKYPEYSVYLFTIEK